MTTWKPLDRDYVALSVEAAEADREWPDDWHPYFIEEDRDFWIDFEALERQILIERQKELEAYWDSIDAAVAAKEAAAAESAAIVSENPLYNIVGRAKV